jgi:molecular chaperone GrpE
VHDEATRQKAEIAMLREQLDRALRAYAESDNLRKRLERDKDETAKYAITRFARDMLSIGDNLQRALASVPPDAIAQSPALKALHEGVSMTDREAVKIMERHGVRRIEPKGEVFNPHFHQAVMETENRDVAAGTILQVFEPGYLIEDRVLRPAMVVVARGGFKPMKAPDPKPAANDDPGPASATGSDPRPGT